jgi:hypothetical protein
VRFYNAALHISASNPHSGFATVDSPRWIRHGGFVAKSALDVRLGVIEKLQPANLISEILHSDLLKD